MVELQPGGPTPAQLSREAAHLLAKYAWAVDLRETVVLADVFTEDVDADYEGFTCRGVAELGDTLERIHAGLLATQHLVGSVLAESGGTDHGRALSQVRATLVAPGSRRLEVAASYLDDLLLTRAGWRVKSRRVRGLWMDGDRTILPWMPAKTSDNKQTGRG